eukprot:gb/GECG01011156.1/.p1 GENE.gb/GECG01011156.1/~~gb/GECG01011156.1/.p1  ORF type:complete len:154 (+),score=10.79 gb/GECG01011156.1/:1-462(+)
MSCRQSVKQSTLVLLALYLILLCPNTRPIRNCGDEVMLVSSWYPPTALGKLSANWNLGFGLSLVEGKRRRRNESKRKVLTKFWKRSKACEDSCSHIHPLENDNCVNECISKVCYDKVYGDNPLEPGEIDSGRRAAFVRCAKKDLDAYGSYSKF